MSIVVFAFHSNKVKLEVSHHALIDGHWKSSKPLVFVLDNPPAPDVKKEKEKKPKGKAKKKEQGSGLTLKNLGGALDIGKVKSATNMVLAWRCRCLALLF